MGRSWWRRVSVPLVWFAVDLRAQIGASQLIKIKKIFAFPAFLAAI
jgi:hypothetical protein